MSSVIVESVEKLVTKVKPKATAVDFNNIVKVRRRAVAAKAVQFTGKNGAEVVAFVKNELGDPTWLHARNGGSYVSIHTNNVGTKARKGDFVVIDADGIVRSYPIEEFSRLFLIKG